MNASVIDTLNTCFLVCLSFCILFFIISVILFFVFDIRTIFNIKTGRAQAKTIKEMKAANDSTGRLRVDGKTQTSKLSEEQKETERAPAVVTPSQQNIRNQYENGSDATVVLADNTAESKDNNSIYAETTLLSDAVADNFADSEISAQSKEKINFIVVKKEMYVHADEMI